MELDASRPPGPDPVERPDDLSARWITGALRHAGFDVDVSEVAFSPIGTGQMADSFRLELSHAAIGSSSAPSSVVVKMQAADELSRQAGARGAYESEVRFYTELAPTLSIRAPECYYAVGPDDHSRFALVLEDLAPAEQGDQLRGCGVVQAQSAVVNLAGLHAPRWCDSALLDLAWLRRLAEPIAADIIQALVVDHTARFVEHYGARVSEADVSILRAFAERSGSWLRGRSERFAPIHGDYRLDNLLFATPAGGSPVATVDWQTVEVGLPGRDLSYFLGNSLRPEDRRKHEQELVRIYHDALLTHGVAGYSLDDCFDDYRYGQFQGPLITVLAAVGLTHTERGDDMFMAMSSRACEAIRDLGSLDLL